MILWRAIETFDLTSRPRWKDYGGRRRRVVVLKEVGRVIAANQNCWEDGRIGTTIKLFGWRYTPRWGRRCYSTSGGQIQRFFLAGTREGRASVLLLVTREVRASNYSDLRSSAVSSMISCDAMTKVFFCYKVHIRTN